MIAIATVCLAASIATNLRGLPKKPTLVVYGDSLSDTGRTYEITGKAWPPLPNTQHFSNGPVWLQYLSKDLNMELESLAIGGATTDSRVIPGFTGPDSNWPVAGARQQWEQKQFLNTANRQHSSKGDEEVHLLCAGTNDFYFTFASKGAVAASDAENILKSTLSIVEAIANSTSASKRSIFVCDLYDLTDTPFIAMMSADVVGAMKKVQNLYNLKLVTALSEM